MGFIKILEPHPTLSKGEGLKGVKLKSSPLERIIT
jgi:hypothetical protein